jgi:ribosomal protein L18E
VSQTFQFYDARAKESAAEAAKAELVMVRERAERSAAVWRSLANQAKKVERDRAKAELIRVERRAAEAEEAARVTEDAEAHD